QQRLRSVNPFDESLHLPASIHRIDAGNNAQVPISSTRSPRFYTVSARSRRLAVRTRDPKAAGRRHACRDGHLIEVSTRRTPVATGARVSSAYLPVQAAALDGASHGQLSDFFTRIVAGESIGIPAFPRNSLNALNEGWSGGLSRVSKFFTLVDSQYYGFRTW
ncbi:MAG TPA: hypothetical protein VFC14_27400, partial [Burkholderiales bacterium]|nr:hypothetical protein [Burkholderiales bacterium]